MKKVLIITLLLVSNMSIFDSLKSEEILEDKNLIQLADFTCGHSLGEYTAMTVAQVFSLKECAILLRLRGEAMQKAVPVGKGAMAALIGISINQTIEIIEKAQIHGICDIGNDNADGQIIMSGDIKAQDIKLM